MGQPKTRQVGWTRWAAWLAATAAIIAAPQAQAQTPSAASASSAQALNVSGPIPTPPQPDGIPLASGGSPASEQWEARGRLGRTVRNVTGPTLTPFLPDPGKATGAAVVVAPGGGFLTLSMDSEGYEVARFLADHGVAAFVLKYRTIPLPADSKAAMRATGIILGKAISSQQITAPPDAMADALAAIRMVRARSAEWHVDPARLGFIGFSAGAILALSVGLDDDPAARPAFIAPIYPPMNARLVPKDAPPMFVAMALDDPLFGFKKPIGLIGSWHDAARPVEAHLYSRGGHGFGFDGHSAASALWPQEFYAWMQDRGLLRAQP